MNPLDELFREKLGEHKVQPSADAWGRVASNIAKKNKRRTVWLGAASVVFLLSAAFAAWQVSRNIQTGNITTIATNAEKAAAIMPEDREKKAVAGRSPVESPAMPSPKRTSMEKLKTPPKKSIRAIAKVEATETSPGAAVTQPVEPVGAVAETFVAMAQTGQETIPTAQEKEMEKAEAPSSERAAEPDPAMVVVYTLQLPAHAEAAAKKKEKKTGLKRVLELAREVRSTDNPIGELRQAKYELLAFDFDGYKEHRNNK